MLQDDVTKTVISNNESDADNCGSIRKGSLDNLPEVLPELLHVLPPDSEAFVFLKKRVLGDNAVHSPLITADIDGKEVLLDGHMRLQLILEHPKQNISFNIKKLTHIHTKEEATCWMIENCNSYRKLSKVQRVELALKAEPLYKKLAAENKKRCGKKTDNLSDLDKFFVPIDCLGLISDAADVSKQYVADAKYIFENGSAEEKKKFRERNAGASKLKKEIEKRILEENKKYEPPVIYVNPERRKYVGEIIQGDCIEVLKNMLFDGINDLVALITSVPYNVGMDYDSCSDDLPYEEYLEFLSKMIYNAQLLGRDGMRICINCTDTYNQKSNEDNGNLMHNIVRDLSNKVAELNKKHDDCNLLYWGNFHWFKDNCNALSYLGSLQAPVLKCDAENILVWVKNQRKLAPQNGINCEPQAESIFSDAERSKYIITQEEYIKWTYQTWQISNNTEKVDHPARFSSEIPHRLIKLFTNPNDGIVLDCCVGSGTVCEEAKKLHRDFVGIDISHKYCEMAKNRVEKAA